MLTNCNALSQNRLKNINEDFRKHSKLLQEMKKDLNYIFKKIREIKKKLEVQYPEAFVKANLSTNQCVDEDEEDINYEQLESHNQIDVALIAES
jgi:KxDL motif-containing protein 1